jgi:hypothetical protein
MMEKNVDEVSLENLHKHAIGGTVLIWVFSPADVAIAQDMVKALCRSLGFDSETRLMTMAEVSEKGGALLGPESGGLLVLCPRGAGISVHAVELMRTPQGRNQSARQKAPCAVSA